MARLTKYEKETILRTSKGDNEYSIFTYDPALQKKLDKFAKDYPDLILSRLVDTFSSRILYP
ncbi:MAG: hypothetical protein Q4B72_15085, partial [Lachnospiraceae bacterium]|nr:hypothetical protein [Lachnospiraceae bacterium]